MFFTFSQFLVHAETQVEMNNFVFIIINTGN